MEDVKDFFKLCSDWLLGTIQTRIIAVLFIVALTVKLTDYFVPIFSIYSTASRVMDIIFLVDFVFTGIAAGNWLFRKLWKGLQQFW